MERNVKTYSQFINEDLIPGGLAKGMSLNDIASHHNIDPSELQIALEAGIRIELEHTTSKDIATEIAMDHLYEDPKYYEKLSSIEEDVRHEGDMWNVYDLGGKKLVGSYGTRDEARKHDDILKKSKRR